MGVGSLEFVIFFTKESKSEKTFFCGGRGQEVVGGGGGGLV